MPKRSLTIYLSESLEDQAISTYLLIEAFLVLHDDTVDNKISEPEQALNYKFDNNDRYPSQAAQ